MAIKTYKLVPSNGFYKELGKLSSNDSDLVLSKLPLLEENPFYPSLRTKKMKGTFNTYESSVNMDIRILWQLDNDGVIALMDVGHHDVLRKY